MICLRFELFLTTQKIVPIIKGANSPRGQSAKMSKVRTRPPSNCMFPISILNDDLGLLQLGCSYSTTQTINKAYWCTKRPHDAAPSCHTRVCCVMCSPVPVPPLSQVGNASERLEGHLHRSEMSRCRLHQVRNARKHGSPHNYQLKCYCSHCSRI